MTSILLYDGTENVAKRQTKKQPQASEGLLIPFGEVRSIVIGAFRYYLGRQTIAVWGFGRWLESAWNDLEEGTRQIIAEELEEAFKDDDEDRAKAKENLPGFPHYRLGHDCDRSVWSGVRALYRTPRCCLCGKEMGKGVFGSVHLDGEYSCVDCAPHECEVCGEPFGLGMVEIISNPITRRARHTTCEAKS